MGNSGTLIVPTFNWDFCNGEPYFHSKTISKCGMFSNNVLFEDNDIRYGSYGISLTNSDYCSIRDNEFVELSTCGLYLSGADHSIISDNIIYLILIFHFRYYLTHFFFIFK